MKLLPNFLIVGAAKSGTTSLFNYLNQHPDIFIPERKEGRFFSQMPGNFQGNGADYQNDIIRDIDEYSSLYNKGVNCKALGDVSNDYLFYYKKSIANIKKHLNRDVKIIVIIRNPTDRAFSNYLHHIREGWETISFENALQAEADRKSKNWAWPFLYKEVGLYYLQVKSFLENFKYVRIFLFEELQNIDVFFKNLFTFLEVSNSFMPETSRTYNASGFPKSQLLHNFIHTDSKLKEILRVLINRAITPEMKKKYIMVLKNKNLKKTSMNSETREYLKGYFKRDILELNNLIEPNIKKLWLK